MSELLVELETTVCTNVAHAGEGRFRMGCPDCVRQTLPAVIHEAENAGIDRAANWLDDCAKRIEETPQAAVAVSLAAIKVRELKR